MDDQKSPTPENNPNADWNTIADEIITKYEFDKQEIEEEVIYHYTTPEGLIGILGNESFKLWFSKYDCLNDKSDGHYVYEVFNAIITDMRGSQQITEEFFQIVSDIRIYPIKYFPCNYLPSPESSSKEQLSDKAMSSQLYETYICCFSAVQDSLPMWNYYTKGTSSRGYNLCLSLAELRKEEGSYNYYDIEFQKVIYDEAGLSSLIRKLIIEVYENENCLPSIAVQIIIGSVLQNLRMLYKSESFKHEEEVRAILSVPYHLPKEDFTSTKEPPFIVDRKRMFRNCNGYVIPYFVCNFNKKALKGITTGPLIEPSTAWSGLSSLIDANGYKWISIEHSKAPIRY